MVAEAAGSSTAREVLCGAAGASGAGTTVGDSRPRRPPILEHWCDRILRTRLSTLLIIVIGLLLAVAAAVVGRSGCACVPPSTRASTSSRRASATRASLPPRSIRPTSSTARSTPSSRLPGVDAALVLLGTDASNRTVTAAGLSEDEVERTIIEMPAHPDLQAIEVVYRYRLDDVEQSSKLPRSALTVAVRADGETIGSLAAITRSNVSGLPADDGRTRRARAARGTGDRQRAAATARPGARRARLAHGPPQPPPLLRVPQPRDRASASLRALRSP